MNSSILDDGAFKSRVYSDSLLSDMENSMDTMPGTPLSKCTEVDAEASQREIRATPAPPSSRRDSRIKSETMLSRVGSFVSLTDAVTLDDIFEYDWADSDSESPDGKMKESYMVQELLADYLKVKSFKRKYPDLTRRTMDAYERSWLQQEGLVPVGRADLGLTALRTDEVMKLLQDDYPEVHADLNDLFQRRRFQQAVELQKRQYEAARIERGEARAEAARRRALDSASDFNHRLVAARLTTRRCYWDLQTMQIHFPQRCYKLIQPPDDDATVKPGGGGSYPVAVIPGQFAEHFVRYTPEQLMHLPLSRCIYSQPSRRHRAPPPLPTQLRFGSLEPRVVNPQPSSEAVQPGENRPQSKEPKSDGNELDQEADCAPVTSSPRSAHCNSQSAGFPSSTSDRRNDRVTKSAANGTTCTESVTCSVCKTEASAPFVRCSECKVAGHPRCFSLPDSMIPGVLSYSWSCMECKRCVECNDSGNEDQMMFCDRCDRGYHAFCVGLKKIPHGNWDCPLCAPQTNRNNKRRRSTAAPRRRSGESRAKRPRKARKRSLSTVEDDSNDEESTVPKPSEISSAKHSDTEGEEVEEREVMPADSAEEEVKPKPRQRRKQRPKVVDDSLLTTSSDEASLTQGSMDSTAPKGRRKRVGPNPPRRRGRPSKAEQIESEGGEAPRSQPPAKRHNPRPSRRVKTSRSSSPVDQRPESPTVAAGPEQVPESKEESESVDLPREKEREPSTSQVVPTGDSEANAASTVPTAALTEPTPTSENPVTPDKPATAL